MLAQPGSDRASIAPASLFARGHKYTNVVIDQLEQTRLNSRDRLAPVHRQTDIWRCATIIIAKGRIAGQLDDQVALGHPVIEECAQRVPGRRLAKRRIGKVRVQCQGRQHKPGRKQH